MSNFYREYVAYKLKGLVESFTLRFIDPAFNGDVTAAEQLAFRLSNDMRGEVAVAMWYAKVARPAFRAFLAAVWEHDHAYLIAAAGNRRRLAAMFRYADFPLPVYFSENVRVWRGTYGITEKEAAKGYSWTIERDIACWFSYRYERSAAQVYEGRAAQVIAADIQRGQIVYYSNERSEQEVVLMKPPKLVWVDGGIDDWRNGYARCTKDKKIR